MIGYGFAIKNGRAVIVVPRTVGSSGAIDAYSDEEAFVVIHANEDALRYDGLSGADPRGAGLGWSAETSAG